MDDLKPLTQVYFLDHRYKKVALHLRPDCQHLRKQKTIHGPLLIAWRAANRLHLRVSPCGVCFANMICYCGRYVPGHDTTYSTNHCPLAEEELNP